CEPLGGDRLGSSTSTAIHVGASDSGAAVSAGSSRPIGTVVHDSATVSGSGPTPGGTVTFSVWLGRTTCPDPTLTPPSFVSSALSLSSGAVDPALSETVPVHGLAYIAHYSGDDTYTSSDSGCEPLGGARLTPTATTEIHDSSESVVANNTIIASGTTMH